MTRLICRKEVEFLTRLKRSTIYSRMNEGHFPQRVKVGRKAVAWREDEIRQWINDPMGWVLNRRGSEL